MLAFLLSLLAVMLIGLVVIICQPISTRRQAALRREAIARRQRQAERDIQAVMQRTIAQLFDEARRGRTGP